MRRGHPTKLQLSPTITRSTTAPECKTSLCTSSSLSPACQVWPSSRLWFSWCAAWGTATHCWETPSAASAATTTTGPAATTRGPAKTCTCSSTRTDPYDTWRWWGGPRSHTRAPTGPATPPYPAAVTLYLWKHPCWVTTTPSTWRSAGSSSWTQSVRWGREGDSKDPSVKIRQTWGLIIWGLIHFHKIYYKVFCCKGNS